MAWQEIAETRRQEIAIAIPEEWKIDVDKSRVNDKSDISVLQYAEKCLDSILTHVELEITKVPTIQLIKKIRSGEWSSLQVTIAFCKRAAIAHQLTNCLTDFLLDEAVKQAKLLDESFKSGKIMGPFHGLPISLKDVFQVKGHDSTWGLISEVGKLAKSDGELVKIYKKLGAIPIAKTNVAQGLLSVESDNNVFGKVLNPHNLSLTAGGSSGGEAALVAMRGSVIGMGTDAGGSIRIPAASTGVYGFMPTPGRITTKGLASLGEVKGLTWVRFAVGPLANDMEAVELYMRTLLGINFDDPSVVPLPWRDPDMSKPLRIGFIPSDGIIEYTPAMKRILDEVELKVKNDKQHIAVKKEVGSLHRDITSTVFSMYISEGCTSYRKSIDASGEPCIKRVCGSDYCPTMSLHQVYELDTKAATLSQKYMDFFADVDVLVMPACANPPAPHGEYSSNCLSAVFNMLGYPAGIVPIGVVDPVKDIPRAEYSNSSYFPDINVPNYTYDRYDKYVKSTLYTDTTKFKNAPLALQLVCSKYEDEKLIEFMKYIDTITH